MYRIASTVLLTWLMALAVRADVRFWVDVLMSADGETPPPDVAVLDIMVDVDDDDAWTAAGLHVYALNGAQLIYADDPNSAAPVLINPGVENRFTTSLSRPRPRFGNARYQNAAAAIPGQYCPPRPAPAYATPFELNVVYFSSPPVNQSSPSVDGAIARIVVSRPALGFCRGADCCHAGIFRHGEVPPTYTAFLESYCVEGDSGTVLASFDNPTVHGESWVFAVHNYLDCVWNLDADRSTIGAGDLAVLLVAFASCPGDPNYNARAALLDLQPCVTIGDLTMLLSHFGDDCCFD